MAKIAGVLLVSPDSALSVEGHTDDLGSAEYNATLSRDRAESVRDYLVEQGVRPEQITVEAYGESEPVASNETAEGRRRNRWVEIVVLKEPVLGSSMMH